MPELNVVAGHVIVDAIYKCEACGYEHVYPVSALMNPGRATCLQCGDKAYRT